MLLRLGIIGLGRIVNSVTTGLHDTNHIFLQAIASRDHNKAKIFAEKNKVPEFYSSYDELINSPNVDVIYIALPNSLHFEYSKKALESNKSVICEKPIVTSSLELKELIKIANEKNLILTEALMYQYNEPFLKIKSLLNDNPIGKIKFIDASFNYSSKKISKDDIRLNQELKGGVINDLLYYPLSFCNAIYGNKPNSIHYLKKNTKKVDITATCIIEYQDNSLAKIQSSFELEDRDEIYIEGDNGRIEIFNFFRFHPEPKFNVFNGKATSFKVKYKKHRYARQFDNLYDMVLSKKKPILDHYDILKNIQTLEFLNN